MKHLFTLILLIVICSNINSQSTTLISNGSSWKYLDNGSNQGTAWYGGAFNDASWASGNAELGYGDSDEATVVSFGSNSSAKYITTYFRKTINAPTASSFIQFTMKLRRDDGIVVYINGAEVYRNNMPTGTILFNTPASTACSDDGSTVFTQTLAANTLTNGTNVIAAEIHQNNGTSSDISFEFELIGVTSIPPANLVKGPYLQIGTPTSMIVRWETDIATNTKVAYGTNSLSLASSATNAAVSTTHSIQLTSLTPYTKYYYSIGTTTAVIQNGADNYFVTSPLPNTEGKYRFWVTGDCGNGSTNQTNCKNQYLAFTGTTVTNGWLLLGDNAYSSGTNTEFNTRFFNYYQNDIMKKAPLWPAPGNHDYYVASSTNYAANYFSIFSTPQAGQAGGVASSSPAYYSYDYGNIHFISLDSYGNQDGNKMYDTLGAQAVWLKNDLAATTKRWKVAYWHHPPYTMGSHNSDSESDLVAVHVRFIRIIERLGVDLVLCGHSHDYERSKLMRGHYGNEASFNAATHNLSTQSGLYDGSANSCPYLKDSVIVKKGTVYVLSGSAGQLGGTQGSFPHNAMHYSNATNGGSMVLDFEANRLDAKWVCADGVIRDKFTIFKDVNRVKTFTVTPTATTNISASWPGNYLWSNSASSRSIAVTVTANTTFWVKDVNTCVADTFKFIVNSALTPNSNFSFSGANCPSTTITYNDASTNSPSSWSWSVNPSAGVTINTPTSQNPTFTFNNPGTYSVTLTSSNTAGPGTPFTQTITINPYPTVNVNNATICSGNQATLAASGASTYSWNSGPTSSSIVVAPTTNTTYIVTGTSLGCSNTKTANVTVNPNPTVSVNNAAICAGAQATLTANGASTYSWNSGPTSSSIVVAPTTNTTYIVTGTSLGCTNTKTANVSVSPSIAVTVNSATICSGNTASLNASGATSYSWNTGPTSANISVSPTITTSYSVTGTSASCSDMKVSTVMVNQNPSLVVSSTNSVMCGGQVVNISVSGATSYTWSDNSNGTSISVSPTVTTTYTVTGVDANGCSTTAMFTQTVANCNGLKAFVTNENIKVYPNPSNGIFNVEANASGNFEIEVTNLIGQVIYKGRIVTGTTKIDLKAKAGIYYYNISENGKAVNQGKLVIE